MEIGRDTIDTQLQVRCVGSHPMQNNMNESNLTSGIESEEADPNESEIDRLSSIEKTESEKNG